MKAQAENLAGSTVGTGILLWSDRYAPIEALPQMFAACEASGVVDQGILTDQANHFVPPSLWNTGTSALAAIHPDPDSMDNAYILAGLCVGQIKRKGMGIGIMCDTVRHGPAELTQMMLTLANYTQGHATLHLGAGEVKNIVPFGWQRAGALEKLDDFFQIFHKLWKSDRPIDHDGNFWKLNQAFLGNGKPHRPRIWAMGGGPRLVDLATSYADGISVAAPNSWSSPEKAAKQIAIIKEQLERKGRDPAQFTFGLDCPALIHDNPEEIERAMKNKMVRYLSGVHGRIDPSTWRNEGIEPAVPDGWNYFLKLKPRELTQQFIDDLLAKTTPEMVRRSWFIGSSKEVAKQIQPYIDAGVNWIAPCDYMPMVATMEDLPKCLPWAIDLCRQVKAANPVRRK